MAETSYIIQNGRRLNLKDATARKSIGSCSELQTDTQHCLVDAINELCRKIDEGGSGTSVEMELIWENAATMSDFAAQEIQLDLSSYEFIQVFGKYESTSYHFNVMSPIVPTTVGVASSMFGLGASFWVGARDFTITANGVSFGAGNQMNMATDAVYNTWNNRIIPSWIVGIRGLR